MNNLFYSVVLLVFLGNSMSGQITITSQTLPDVGDVLTYTTFNDFQDTLTYKENGENLFWSFEAFNILGTAKEDYLDITQTNLADSFPAANMVVSIAGFQTAAIRTDSSIEVIGLETGDFTGFGIEAKAVFDEPYEFRKTPITYGDDLADDFEFVIQFSSELIPGLDTFPVPIPGTTIDSVRITTTVFKSEHVTAWGTLNILDNEMEVLKVEQADTTSTKIELGLGSILGVFWLDVTPLLGDLGINQNRKTYKFLSADSKESIVEFNESIIQDTIIIATGRISAEIISGIYTTKHHAAFNIYPNPAYDYIVIDNLEKISDFQEIFIVDHRGRLVLQVDAPVGQPISISHLYSGNYFILSKIKENWSAQSLVILR